MRPGMGGGRPCSWLASSVFLRGDKPGRLQQVLSGAKCSNEPRVWHAQCFISETECHNDRGPHAVRHLRDIVSPVQEEAFPVVQSALR